MQLCVCGGGEGGGIYFWNSFHPRHDIAFLFVFNNNHTTEFTCSGKNSPVPDPGLNWPDVPSCSVSKTWPIWVRLVCRDMYEKVLGLFR